MRTERTYAGVVGRPCHPVDPHGGTGTRRRMLHLSMVQGGARDAVNAIEGAHT